MRSTKENHLVDDFNLLIGHVSCLGAICEDNEFLPILIDIKDRLEEFSEVHIEPWPKSAFPKYDR